MWNGSIYNIHNESKHIRIINISFSYSIECVELGFYVSRHLSGPIGTERYDFMIESNILQHQRKYFVNLSLNVSGIQTFDTSNMKFINLLPCDYLYLQSRNEDNQRLLNIEMDVMKMIENIGVEKKFECFFLCLN